MKEKQLNKFRTVKVPKDGIYTFISFPEFLIIL